MQKLTLGFSPCPNDTFIFDAMLHDKIDTEGLAFEFDLLDVEALNTKAFDSYYDITKLSYAAYFYCLTDYIMLNSGGALGEGCGPLLIAKHLCLKKDISSKTSIAIPGKYTTANLLLSAAFPGVLNTTEMLFSDIEDAVVNEQTEAGVIIHENRFTYQNKGLHKIIDLGAFWEKKYMLPIPLGGIAIKRNFNREIQQKVQRVLKRSILFAFENHKGNLVEFVKEHAKEMAAEVINQHISLYVNNYTVNIGKRGKEAVEKMRLYILNSEKGLVVPESKLFIE